MITWWHMPSIISYTLDFCGLAHHQRSQPFANSLPSRIFEASLSDQPSGLYIIRIMQVDGNQHARQKSYGTKDVAEEVCANVSVFGVAPSNIKTVWNPLEYT
jgi:hypothetical protein